MGFRYLELWYNKGVREGLAKPRTWRISFKESPELSNEPEPAATPCLITYVEQHRT